jgi:hypothetical protein
MAPVGPSEFENWERALCNQFLAASDGDASPIRSIEITRYTLAASREGQYTDPAEAVRAFRAAMDINDVCSAVEHGHYRRLDRVGLPGCFSYLALTLYVDSLIEDDAEGVGAFRSKLAGFLRVDRAFSNLSGVADMWRDLATWLDAKIKKGESFRRLVLPDPGSWTHIGHTARLSFPSRRDKALLRAFLADNPRAEGPAAFLARFRNAVAGPKASWGLKQAFGEFHAEFLAGRRALADHRFWAFVQEVTRGLRTVPHAVLLSVDLSKDQDEDWFVTIEADEGERQHFGEMGTAATKLLEMPPNELAASCNRGFLVFRQVGNAKWRAVPDLSECIGRVIIGLSAATAGRVGRRLGDLEHSGSWLLTAEPVTVSAAERAAAALGLSGSARDYIAPVSVVDGQRTGSFWLGRPPFLPRINADNDDLSVHPEASATGSIRCVADERSPGVFRLVADGPIEGSFLLSPHVPHGATRRWTRRVTFVADALIHDAIRAPAASDPLVEWEGPPQAAGSLQIRPSWDDQRSSVDDLVEAVYAGGRTGWNEMDLVSLVRGGLGPDLNPWDIIRSLQESTCLKPMLRAQWRGRVWALGEPSLRIIGETNVVVDGCISARLAGEFRRAAESAGGTAFRVPGRSVLAPPLIGAIGGDVARLTDALQWARSTGAVACGGKLAFQVTERRPERYELQHRWSFGAGRFIRAFGQAGGPVNLERWVHPTARDHDLYVVTQRSRKWHLLSRPAAVTFAHCLAGVPLFDWSGGLLRRTTREGALPDALAASARYRHLANPGVVANGYAYVVDEQFVRQLADMLPNLVRGLKDSAGNDPAEAVSLAVHSGGRIRTAWKKGSLSTIRS